MKDKMLHFGVGFAFGSASIILKNIPYLEWIFWIGIAVFIGKEIFDVYKPKPTGFSILDFFADFFGFGIGLILTNYVIAII